MTTAIRIILLAAGIGVGSLDANAGPDPAARCQHLEQARQRLFEQLRRPHGVNRGNQLRARLRELNERIAADCH